MEQKKLKRSPHRYGERMKDFNKVVLEIFEKHNATEKIELSFREAFINSTLDDYMWEYKWQFHVFQKQSIYKHGYSKIDYNPR